MTQKSISTTEPAHEPSSAELGLRFQAVRERTEALASPLSPEDMVVQSMPDVSPTKWHLAHTTWFFETFILKGFNKAYKEFDAAYCYLFNSYYNGVGDRHPRPKRGLLTRPPLDQIQAYRAHVTEAVAQFLDAAEGSKDWRDISRLMTLGCHHEEQHQELLLTDIKHVLFQNPLKPAYSDKPAPLAGAADTVTWKAFPEGVVEIGQDGNGFAFDCEGPRHKTYLQAFEIASRSVSNGEFLEFIKDGGYEKPDLWLSDGWTHIRENALQHPLYWTARDDDWRVFTMRGEHPIDPGAPACHLSYYEADAYARWAGARLPTEAEHEIAADSAPGPVWEWTSSAYLPYPGFKAAKGAVGEYNGKFMSGQMVLRGGSHATPPGHWRPTYRNFFYPPNAWQFTGLRLARDT